MNRLDQLFEQKRDNILSLYFTAGYPELDLTEKILLEIEKSGVDFVEIGMPFSDPVADGPVIQASSLKAIHNGMTVEKLFCQLDRIREKVSIPLVLMGYFNPVYHYGVEKFCARCENIGIDGVILPDMPVSVYCDEYKEVFEKHNLHNILLITPQTTDDRIRYIDSISKGFVYVVSTSSTTGVKEKDNFFNTSYLERVKNLNLKNPTIVGFGISNRDTFRQACEYTQGAIIGSKFVSLLEDREKSVSKISNFINDIL